MHRGTNAFLADDSEAYWARRGLAGVSDVEGARRKPGRPSSPGTRRIDRELGSSLRSLAFMDDEDLSPYAKARMQRLESQLSNSSSGSSKQSSSVIPQTGATRVTGPGASSMATSTAGGPAVHLQPLTTDPAAHLQPGGSTNEYASPTGFSRLTDGWSTSSSGGNPSIPTTPAYVHHSSFWNDQPPGSGYVSSPTRASHSPAPSSTYSSSPRPKSALTNSLLEQRASPQLSSLNPNASATSSPAAKTYMQAMAAAGAASASSSARPPITTNASTHTSPRLGKRTLSPLGGVEEGLTSFGLSTNAASSSDSSSRRGSIASSSGKGVPLQHSRRTSASGSADLSIGAQQSLQAQPDYMVSPSRSSASGGASGVYRPPHLRHRDSGSGLVPSVAHYDRVRTPSLRGQSRSRESSISVASRAPLSTNRSGAGAVAIPTEESSPNKNGSGEPVALTAEAVAKYLGTQPAPLNRSFTLSSLASSRYADELEEKLEAHERATKQDDQQQAALYGRAGMAGFNMGSLRKSIDSVALSDDLELSAEDMMRSSLTESYILSRRNSMASGENGEGVVDIFDIGDRLGPGMMHDGHLITIAESSSGFQAQEGDLTGSRLEVVGKLGEGSYACVYLVREVFDEDTRRFGQQESQSGQQDGEHQSSPSTMLSSTPTASDALRKMAKRTSSLGPSSSGEVGDVTVTNGEGVFGSTLRADESPLAIKRAQEQQQSPPGREFALKCLCKRDLSPEMLEVQRLEATIHQSIPPHPNIVTLYRTYETPEWLFLVLEYCPGQDLFYWLEQAQDDVHRPSQTPDANHDTPQVDLFKWQTASQEAHATDSTPPDPSILATTAGISILSRRRLRLISRMFRQMCDAVQFCHDRGISHRDLKPENFIVEDNRCASSSDFFQTGRQTPSNSSSEQLTSPVSMSDSVRDSDRRVTVKLTDFGLATAEPRCNDFECGSKPYMSFECRNDVEPTYDPKPADVWSLGVVLLNMLFHRNPFKEPAVDRCPSFAAFREDPTRFLMEAFDGLTQKAADFLANRVFCDVQTQKRVTAAEFGVWAADLVDHMGLLDSTRSSTPSRGAAMGITSALQHSRSRSSMLSTSSSVVMLSALASPGIEPAIPEVRNTSPQLENSPDVEPASKDEMERTKQQEQPKGEHQTEVDEEAVEVLAHDHEEKVETAGLSPESDTSPESGNFERGRTEVREDCDSSDEEQEASKPTSQGRRRKRGARKSRSTSKQTTVPSSPTSPAPEFVLREKSSVDRLPALTAPRDAVLTGLAEASQTLAREISKATQEKRIVDAKIASLGAYAYESRSSVDSDYNSPRSPILGPSSGGGPQDVSRRLQDSGRTQPTSWREGNQSSFTLASNSSRYSLSSDDASIYSTASAPAAYARKSHDSSKQRQARGVFGKSTSGLPSISEKGKKELDASYLAEIFGGSASSHKSSHHHHRRDRGGRSELHSYHGRDYSADPYRGSSRRDAHRHDPKPTSSSSGGSSASGSTSKFGLPHLSSSTSRSSGRATELSSNASVPSSGGSRIPPPNGYDHLAALQSANAPRGTPIVIPNGSMAAASAANSSNPKRSEGSSGGSGFSKFFKRSA